MTKKEKLQIKHERLRHLTHIARIEAIDGVFSNDEKVEKINNIWKELEKHERKDNRRDS